MYAYIALMTVFAIVPSIVLTILNKDRMDFRTLAVSVAVLAVVGTTWDYISVEIGIWTFFSGELIGVYIGSLPLEKYLFMIFVPLLVINVFVFFLSIRVMKGKNKCASFGKWTICKKDR